MITTIPVITWFQELDRNAIAVAGGKGANLGELQTMGLPVPPGFVITTAAYRHFVDANQLQDRILALADQAQESDPVAGEAISRQIYDLFVAAVMPDELAAPIQSAYQGLIHESSGAVAVRSSATAEDLPSASFAGQQETYLNIHNATALLKAVKACWASLWTGRAMVYRARQKIDPATVMLAVVVQKMVAAEAAGILFTANPVNGQRNQVVIDAAWGLGEAIVSSQVTPDHWVIDKTKNAILSSTVADKSTMTVRTAHGTKEQAVPDAKRKRPAITPEIALKLAKYGMQIEDHYQMPMDIEWAVAAGEIAILQARPITALPEPVADPPTEWPMPFEQAMFVRGSITEQLPDPLSPLFATMAPAEMTKSLANLYQYLAGKRWEGIGFTLINNYVYVYMEMKARTWMPMFGFMGVMKDLPKIGTKVWRDEFLPRYRQSIATWQAKSPREWTATELITGAQELLYRGTELYTGVQVVIPLAVISESLFSEFYNRFVKGPTDPPAQTFLIGFDSQPIHAEKALYDLAMWSRDQPGLAEMLRATAAATLAEMIQTGQTPNGVDAGLWQAWRTRFDDYLHQFGHAIYNMDFVNPVPADAPTPLLETLKFYLQGQGANPYQRQQEAVAKRNQSTQAVMSRLDSVRGAIFGKLLAWAQRVGPVREDALSTVGLGWPLLRQLLLEVGHRLVAAGAIVQPSDIFWLEKAEVAQAAAALDAGLDAGTTRLESFDAPIAERKMIWRGQKRATPPQVLPESSWWKKAGLDRFMPAVSTEQSGPVIRGVPVGAGQVTATARVLHGPEDFGKLQPGDVLVAGITTPAWTPLFARAAAVVTDIGGPMSHSSIVAREYGIPAVLGTGIATKRIQSGQLIRVDGDAGTVTLLDEVGAEALPVATPGKSKAPKASLKTVALSVLILGFVLGFMLWLQKRRRRAQKQ